MLYNKIFKKKGSGRSPELKEGFPGF